MSVADRRVSFQTNVCTLEISYQRILPLHTHSNKDETGAAALRSAMGNMTYQRRPHCGPFRLVVPAVVAELGVPVVPGGAVAVMVVPSAMADGRVEVDVHMLPERLRCPRSPDMSLSIDPRPKGVTARSRQRPAPQAGVPRRTGRACGSTPS
jgi:hypothetical protein